MPYAFMISSCLDLSVARGGLFTPWPPPPDWRRYRGRVSFSFLATRFVSAFAGDAAADAKRAMTPATAARRLTPLREGGREGGRRQGRTDARGSRRRRRGRGGVEGVEGGD